ncbi:hypothetical protein IID19_03180 [Patescibacteria group bacterium]|nr:hypothetical protein [Patescibacteria group bacterium]
MSQRLNDIVTSVKMVLSKPWFVVLALLVTTILVAINSLLPQRDLMATIFTSDSFDGAARAKIVGSLLLTFGVNVTLTGKVLFAIITITAGISISLLVYYLKNRIKFDLAGGTSTLGIFLSLIGVGCASCGSVILSSVIGLSATGAFVGFLPLQGLEIGLLSLSLLMWSIYSVSKKIQNPLLCKVAPSI